MKSRLDLRRILVAVLAGVLIGGGLMAVTPAGAEVGKAVATNWKKVWKQELQPLADKRYYTKKKSDKRYAKKADLAGYAPAGSSYTKAESDARYYTKAQSDSNYYTKAQGDARYLPKRSVLTGPWASGAIPSGSQPVLAINFPAVLSAAPTAAYYMAPGAAPTAQCPGNVDAPDAAPGVLCVYAGQNLNFNNHYFFNVRADGAILAATSTSNSSYMWGNWAVRPAGYAAASASAAKSGTGDLTGSAAGR